MQDEYKEPASQASRPLRGRKFLLLLVLTFLIGTVSTGHLIGGAQFPALKDALFSPAALFSGLICVLLTTCNLLLRWFRWHFLIRRFTPHLVTRDSLAIYMATLPAILSPFFIAELGRVWLIRRRFRTPASFLVRVWFTERCLDFSVVAAALLVALASPYKSSHSALDWISFSPSGAILAVTSLALLIAVLFRLILRTQALNTVTWVAAASLLLTILAWALPIFALKAGLSVLGTSLSVNDAVRTFSAGTLLGGLTGLPLGVYATGSIMVSELVNAGVPDTEAALAILVYRSGTAWYAVVLGICSLIVFRKRIIALVRGHVEAHFDEIAGEYEGEIPRHVRERLLDKKVLLMKRTLLKYGVREGARGLDLGCGQGWYLAEMRKLGFQVDGTDYSQGQLDRATNNFQTQGMHPGVLVQADAQALPFLDNSYDFVYSINAIHHILAEGAQQRALSEVVRVLRPGGVFMLHEMNTYNPVFRWYMGYIFPLLKKIDEGNEEWILPTELPHIKGAAWDKSSIEYFTFLPDFIPQFILAALTGLEGYLENSPFRRMSAHYQACLIKEPNQTPTD